MPTEVGCFFVLVEAQSRRTGCAVVHLRVFSIHCCSQLSLAQFSFACTDRRIDIIISRHRSKVTARCPSRSRIGEQIVGFPAAQILEQIVIEPKRK